MLNSRIDFLLAILELARAEGDPLENPSPWSWPKWKEILLGVGSEGLPPWASNATFDQTGLQDSERGFCKIFVQAYHVAGQTPLSRRQYATALEEGDEYKGLCHLTRWSCRLKATVECEIDRVLKRANLITGGVQTIVQIGLCNPTAVIKMIADGLLGERAFQEPTEHAYAWSSYAFGAFRVRWEVVYNSRMRFVDKIPREIYAAFRDVSRAQCCYVDVHRYLVCLGDLLVELDFDFGEDRERQREHYRNLLDLIASIVDGTNVTGKGLGVCLPPNMTRALDVMEEGAVEAVLNNVAFCRKVVDAGDDYIVEEFPEEFDAFGLLAKIKVSHLLDWDSSTEERAACARVEDDLRLTESLTADWNDEETAAYLFTMSSLPRFR